MIVEYTSIGCSFRLLSDAIEKSGLPYILNPQGGASLMTYDVFVYDAQYLSGMPHKRFAELCCFVRSYSDDEYKNKQEGRGI